MRRPLQMALWGARVQASLHHGGNMINMTCGSFLAVNDFFVDVTWDVTCLAWDATWDIGCWFIALSRSSGNHRSTALLWGHRTMTWRISASWLVDPDLCNTARYIEIRPAARNQRKNFWLGGFKTVCFHVFSRYLKSWFYLVGLYVQRGWVLQDPKNVHQFFQHQQLLITLWGGDKGWIDEDGYLYLIGRDWHVCILFGFLKKSWWDLTAHPKMIRWSMLKLWCVPRASKSQNLRDLHFFKSFFIVFSVSPSLQIIRLILFSIWRFPMGVYIRFFPWDFPFKTIRKLGYPHDILRWLAFARPIQGAHQPRGWKGTSTPGVLHGTMGWICWNLGKWDHFPYENHVITWDHSLFFEIHAYDIMMYHMVLHLHRDWPDVW